MLRLFLTPLLLAGFATAASAQTAAVTPADSSSMPASGQQVRVSVAVSTFVAAPTDGSAQSLKVQADGRRKVYELAANECGMLRDILAGDCRLESINVNVQRVSASQNYNQPRVEGYNINGTVNLCIVTK
jgi:hypothetical protein